MRKTNKKQDGREELGAGRKEDNSGSIANEASGPHSPLSTLQHSSLSTRVFALSGYRRADFSVCLGCRICASVCTVNDLGIDTNPQDLLVRLFLGQGVDKSDGLIRNCTSCYRCTSACPWQIRIPEVVRALREDLGLASPFEKAFKGSVRILGRVYEPYVFLMAVPFLVKEGYLKHMTRWMEYMSVHLPHKVRRIRNANAAQRQEGE